jgi:hypothetical protein
MLDLDLLVEMAYHRLGRHWWCQSYRSSQNPIVIMLRAPPPLVRGPFVENDRLTDKSW